MHDRECFPHLFGTWWYDINLETGEHETSGVPFSKILADHRLTQSFCFMKEAFRLIVPRMNLASIKKAIPFSAYISRVETPDSHDVHALAYN